MEAVKQTVKALPEVLRTGFISAQRVSFSLKTEQFAVDIFFY